MKYAPMKKEDTPDLATTTTYDIEKPGENSLLDRLQSAKLYVRQVLGLAKDESKPGALETAMTRAYDSIRNAADTIGERLFGDLSSYQSMVPVTVGGYTPADDALPTTFYFAKGKSKNVETEPLKKKQLSKEERRKKKKGKKRS